MTNTPIIISLISLCISMFTAWMTWVQPFRPKFSIGNIFLIPVNGSTLNIGVQFSIFNMGSKIGVINDFMLIVESNDIKFKSIWFPMHFYDSQQHLENKLLKKADLFSMKGIFSPFLVNPKSTSIKEIMFQTYKSDGIFLEGDYTFYFFFKNQDKFEIIDTRIERIGQSALNNIKTNTITGIMPFQYRDVIVKERLP